MCYARLDIQTPTDRRVVFKLELEPEYPRQPSLLLRGNGGEQEQPLRFLEQADGYDYFIIELTAPQPFEYALRVTRPDQNLWITPKGEEHDRLPHNWFRYPPQSRIPSTTDAAAPDLGKAPLRVEAPPRPSFETPAWVRDAVFYQIFTERFARGEPARDPLGVQPWGSPPTNGNFMGGNLQGILDRLDYLTDLGISALYLTPIFQSPSNHKYDTMDYFTVDPQFGDLGLLRQLVEACHQRGLRVVLDGVFNHCFQKALIGYFAEERMDTHAFDQTLRYLLQDYPEPATAVMLNLLGSHDTARPMTVVHQREGSSHALESLKLMAAMQFTCTGAPCIYYGDEIGMEGDKDPDCRRCYPWDWEQRAKESDQRSELLAYYKRLISVRKDNPALRHGGFRTLEADSRHQFYAFERHSPDNRCIVALNRGDHDHALPLAPDLLATELLNNRPIRDDQVTVPARQAIIVRLADYHSDPKALARRLYWERGFNQTVTARKFNERGVPHPAGRKWRQKDIAALV